MCIFAGMQIATVRMIPASDFTFRDRCVHFYKLNYDNPEKAHLYY